MDLCGTLCTPGQVLEDSLLQVWTKNMILSISTTDPNKLMLNLGISIQFSVEHVDHTLHNLCQLTLSEVNPTQILLIFESMQHCRNDREQEKTLLTHFCCCFHATYISNLDTWWFVVVQGDHIKYIVAITVGLYFEVYCIFKSYFAQKSL